MENEYKVTVRRDVEMMKTFVKFSNRLNHPRVSAHLFILGAALITVPLSGTFGKLALWITAVCYVFGALFIWMSLFRHCIGVAQMRNNPEIKENEEITYIFNSNNVCMERGGTVEIMGGYKKIYRMWEDEKHLYVGMNEEDLLILPKETVPEGQAEELKAFILKKSKADCVWKPANFINICKNIGKKQSEMLDKAVERSNNKKK